MAARRKWEEIQQFDWTVELIIGDDKHKQQGQICAKP